MPLVNYSAVFLLSRSDLCNVSGRTKVPLYFSLSLIVISLSLNRGLRVGDIYMEARECINENLRRGDLLTFPGVFRVDQLEDRDNGRTRLMAQVWRNNFHPLGWNVRPGTNTASPRGGTPDR